MQNIKNNTRKKRVRDTIQIQLFKHFEMFVPI